MDASSRDKQDKQATKKPGSVCHSLLSEDLAARPPVKATLRLASLGLDGTRPTPREETGRREWQRTGTDSKSGLRLADGEPLPNGPGFLKLALDKDRPSHGSRDRKGAVCCRLKIV